MTQILEHKEIPDTPFTAIRHLDSWFLTLGKYRLTEKLNSYEDVVDASKDASWFRLMALINIMIIENQEIQQLQKQVNDLYTNLKK